MRKMKWFAALAIFAAFAFNFTACGNPSGSDDSSGSGSQGGGQSGRTKVDGKIGEYGYPYEVGDIVFKDGSATQSTDLTDAQKAAAIAVIFYKGNQLNSDDAAGNAVTNKERILGVGLVQSHSSMGEYWGSGYGANRDMTSIKCSVRGENGNWVISGDKDGHDNLYQMAVELKSDNDIYATVDKYYYAFLFALHYAEKTTNQLKNTPYENGWYLPSIAELYYLWKKVEVVNKASKLCGGEAFGEKQAGQTYWSSSKSTTEAEVYTFNFNLTGNKYDDGKIESKPRNSFVNNLCAIRDFTEGATSPVIPRPDAEEGKLGLYSKPYEFNDIMLKDGSVIPYKPGLVLTDAQKAAVESIIYYAGCDKMDGTNEWPQCALGLGLEESDEKLKWCTSDAYLYDRSFDYSKCTVAGNAGEHTFTASHLMGELNFTYLKVNLRSTSDNISANISYRYPAMWFAGPDDPVVTGSTASVGTDIHPWYLPTIAEMFYMWKAKDDVNKVLDLLDGDLLRTDETYWSSSQSPEWNETKKVMTIKMSNGDCSIATDKTTELYVRMIKAYDNMLYSH